jgi:integrase
MPKLADGLTDTKIRNAKPKEKPYKLSDGNGLTLLINPNGSKWWRLRYYFGDKEKMLSLGVYPKVGLQSAREKAMAAVKEIDMGNDPGAARKEAKRADSLKEKGTFKATSEAWYAHKAQSWASETARKARETLDDYLLPKLADKVIADIATSDIKPVLLSVHERAPRLAVKARQYCNQIIDYAIQEGLREDGKLLSLKGALPKSKAVHYAAVTKSNDLPSLIKAIKGIDSEHSRTALLACLYTASRPGVVAGMRWDELDLNAKEWHIPADRMKTGNDHISPLPDQLVRLIESLKPMAGESPFVFPGNRNPIKQHIHRDSLSKVLRENGLQGVTVTHGFRATFRTIARERLRAVPDVLEAQLAHAKKDEIQAAYDRAQFLEERHELIQKWADYLDQIQVTGNVVQMTDKVA